MVEEDKVDVGVIFGIGVGLLAVGAAVYFAVWLLFGYFANQSANATREYPLAATAETRLPPEPRLQTDPRGDLRAMREQEDRTLHSYEWVDRSAGVVRIPIDQAMRLTVERGLPARPHGAGR